MRISRPIIWLTGVALLILVVAVVGPALGEPDPRLVEAPRIDSTLTLTTTSVEDPYVGGEPPAADHRFVRIELFVRNVDAEPAPISTRLMFRLRDDAGAVYEPTHDAAPQESLDVILAVGENASGALIFEVPVSTEGLVLDFRPNVTGDEWSGYPLP